MPLRLLSLAVACWVVVAWVLCAESALSAESGADERPPLLVVYFLPTDIPEPLPEHVARFDRILTHVQQFYAREMDRLGYGPLTYDLERDEAGTLVVHTVRGTQTTADYDRSTRNVGGRMVEQTRQALADEGVDTQGRVLLLVAPLLVADGKESLKEVGPYMGGGNHVGGTAWVFDHPRLDTEWLASKEPGGFYHGPCSWGKFNTHYIGGIAHELGHAFGLPHVYQVGAEAERGTALMGSGNHTWGQELRGEGKGTFLTRTSANILAGCAAFVGPLPKIDRTRARLSQMAPTYDDGVLSLAGTLATPHTVVGVSIYNDRSQPGGDYDAHGYYSDVTDDGQFSASLADLKPGDWQLRLLFRHTSGEITRQRFDYKVDDQGQPDLAPLTVGGDTER